MTHIKDTDCVVDPTTDCCITCGVYHGYPCPACGQRGYHKPDCPQINRIAVMPQLTIKEVYGRFEAISVLCNACEEDFIWSIANREPDFCPMCGIQLDLATFTNPDKMPPTERIQD